MYEINTTPEPIELTDSVVSQFDSMKHNAIYNAISESLPCRVEELTDVIAENIDNSSLGFVTMKFLGLNWIMFKSTHHHSYWVPMDINLLPTLYSYSDKTVFHVLELMGGKIHWDLTTLRMAIPNKSQVQEIFDFCERNDVWGYGTPENIIYQNSAIGTMWYSIKSTLNDAGEGFCNMPVIRNIAGFFRKFAAAWDRLTEDENESGKVKSSQELYTLVPILIDTKIGTEYYIDYDEEGDEE